MRQKDKLIIESEAWSLLEKSAIATIAPNKYPYAVVVNHIVFSGKVYFHSAIDWAKE